MKCRLTLELLSDVCHLLIDPFLLQLSYFTAPQIRNVCLLERVIPLSVYSEKRAATHVFTVNPRMLSCPTILL